MSDLVGHYEERAAIKEYCGCMTRGQAEWEAWEEIIMGKGSKQRRRDDCGKVEFDGNWDETFEKEHDAKEENDKKEKHGGADRDVGGEPEEPR